MLDFNKKLDRVKTVVRRLPPKAGVVAVSFSKERFIRKNWVNDRKKKWPERKRKTRGSLLVQSGRLKRSIRKIRSGNGFVLIGTDVPYAEIHNEGGHINKTVQVKAHTRRRTVKRQTTNIRTRKTRTLKGRVQIGDSTVKAHSRKMNLRIQQRQFMGESAILLRRIERMAIKEINQALKDN